MLWRDRICIYGFQECKGNGDGFEVDSEPMKSESVYEIRQSRIDR